MQRQIRDEQGNVLHLQTSENRLAMRIPGAHKPFWLTAQDISKLRQLLQEAQVELLQTGGW